LIIQHHAGKPGGDNQRVFAVHEGAGLRLPEGFPAINGLEIMIEPIIVEAVHPALFRLGKLCLKGAEFGKYAIVPHSPHGGNAAETDGQEVQPPGDTIPRLHAAEKPGIQYPETLDLPDGTGFPRRVPVDDGIFLHDLELGQKRFLAGDLPAYLHILGSFHIEMRHVSLLPDS
jgi:hypothetical protein